MRLIIENGFYEEIPYNEYYLENIEYKGLVFMQHGFQSNKNRGADYLAINIARQGYFVVSIDAYKHGERIEEPYITMDDFYRLGEIYKVVDQTSDDIITLFKNKYSSIYNEFDLIGVSMGGFIAFVTSLKTNCISKLVPTITTINFKALAEDSKDQIDLALHENEYNKFVENIMTIDPYSQVDQLKYKDMFILNGERDELIPYKHNKDFFMKSNGPVKFALYNAKHEVNREMQKDIIEFITNEKVEL